MGPGRRPDGALNVRLFIDAQLVQNGKTCFTSPPEHGQNREWNDPREDPDLKATENSRYVVKSLVHASEVLNSFHSPAEVLRLRDVVARTGFNKGMCFRLLYTLHQCGFIEKVGENSYRMMAGLGRRQKCRLGYAAQGQDSSFPREVQCGLVRAAEAQGIELIVVDNRYNPKVALRNADHLLR